jgi:hypothetical protein
MQAQRPIPLSLSRWEGNFFFWAARGQTPSLALNFPFSLAPGIKKLFEINSLAIFILNQFLTKP